MVTYILHRFLRSIENKNEEESMPKMSIFSF